MRQVARIMSSERVSMQNDARRISGVVYRPDLIALPVPIRCICALLCRCHNEHPLEVPSHCHEVELTLHVAQTTQQKLPESEYRFEDAEYWFHRALTPGVERLTGLGLESMLHRLHRGRAGGKRCGFGEARERTLMVLLTCAGDGRIYRVVAQVV